LISLNLRKCAKDNGLKLLMEACNELFRVYYALGVDCINVCAKHHFKG